MLTPPHKRCSFNKILQSQANMDTCRPWLRFLSCDWIFSLGIRLSRGSTAIQSGLYSTPSPSRCAISLTEKCSLSFIGSAKTKLKFLEDSEVFFGGGGGVCRNVAGTANEKGLLRGDLLLGGNQSKCSVNRLSLPA